MSFPSDLRAPVSGRVFLFWGCGHGGGQSRRDLCGAGERTPPPACGGHLPFQGRLCGKCAKRLPPQRELSAVRLTEDKPSLWGRMLSRRESISSTIRCREWSPSFCGRRQGVAAKPPQVSVSPLTRRGGGFPIAPATPSVRSLCYLVVAQRWQVAAALSAAVTTAPQKRTAPNSQGRASPKEESSLFPTALRERGVWGERRFSQRSGLSPQRLPTPSSLEEGARGRGLFFRKASSLAINHPKSPRCSSRIFRPMRMRTMPPMRSEIAR